MGDNNSKNEIIWVAVVAIITVLINILYSALANTFSLENPSTIVNLFKQPFFYIVTIVAVVLALAPLVKKIDLEAFKIKRTLKALDLMFSAKEGVENKKRGSFVRTVIALLKKSETSKSPYRSYWVNTYWNSMKKWFNKDNDFFDSFVFERKLIRHIKKLTKEELIQCAGAIDRFRESDMSDSLKIGTGKDAVYEYNDITGYAIKYSYTLETGVIVKDYYKKNDEKKDKIEEAG